MHKRAHRYGGSKLVDKANWKILIVDDEESVHAMTKLVAKKIEFEKRGIDFFSAYNSEEAKQIIKQESDLAVIIMDVAMETADAGLILTEYIREELRNRDVRIIIRTGQPGTAPENEVILKYDINDYREKTELSYQKLVTSITIALRSYRDIQNLKKSKQDLERAKKEADKANNIKTQFLANMSHEMRTPMNGIMGIAQLLLYTKLDEQQKEYIELLKESSERLMRIINDILDLSKIESGEIKVSEKPFHLREVFEKMISEYKEIIKNKKLLFKTLYDDKLPEVILGDELKMIQIISNVLGNAVKFTLQGEIFLEFNRGDDESIQIIIGDTGIGIPQESKEVIFDIFTQVDESNTRKFGGTGLGLAITKQLVNKMNGKIEVESELGKGSRFIITLPLVCENVILEANEEKGNENLANEISILLAEDDLINQKVIHSLLEARGYEVDIAVNGEEVITKSKEKKYDVILMDISIPIIDGLEATKIIREAHINKNTPIIALTAHVYSSIREVCLQNGMNDYLAKPVKADELYEKIESFGVESIEKPYEDKAMQVVKHKDILKDIVDAFLNTNYTDELIENIKTAYTIKDYNSLKLHAHRGKSSFKTLGSERGYEILAEVENVNTLYIKPQDFDQLIGYLMDEIADVKAYYRENYKRLL